MTGDWEETVLRNKIKFFCFLYRRKAKEIQNCRTGSLLFMIFLKRDADNINRIRHNIVMITFCQKEKFTGVNNF